MAVETFGERGSFLLTRLRQRRCQYQSGPWGVKDGMASVKHKRQSGQHEA